MVKAVQLCSYLGLTLFADSVSPGIRGFAGFVWCLYMPPPLEFWIVIQDLGFDNEECL